MTCPHCDEEICECDEYGDYDEEEFKYCADMEPEDPESPDLVVPPEGTLARFVFDELVRDVPQNFEPDMTFWDRLKR